MFNVIFSVFFFLSGSGRNAHQNLGDDLSSNIIIGATPSHWNNDGRGKNRKKLHVIETTWILRSFLNHKWLDAT